MPTYITRGVAKVPLSVVHLRTAEDRQVCETAIDSVVTPDVVGERVEMAERVVVSAAVGRFRPGPEVGSVIPAGGYVGSVGDVPIRSGHEGHLAGYLALPGQRVSEGTPLAWLTPTPDQSRQRSLDCYRGSVERPAGGDDRCNRAPTAAGCGTDLVRWAPPGARTTTYHPRRTDEGLPGWLHGGIVTMLLDEEMAKSASQGATPYATAVLNVRFRKPILLKTREVTVISWNERQGLPKVQSVRAEVRLPDGVVAISASGLFARLK